MAVTTQKSTEYTNATSTPVTQNPVHDYHGRVRIAYFTHDQDGAGDATSSVALCALPAGKVRVLLASSSAYVNWTTGSATLDLGWDAYTNTDGTAVSAVWELQFLRFDLRLVRFGFYSSRFLYLFANCSFWFLNSKK